MQAVLEHPRQSQNLSSTPRYRVRPHGHHPRLRHVSLEAAVGLYVLYNDILEEDFDDARVCLLPRDNAPATGQASPLAGPAVS